MNSLHTQQQLFQQDVISKESASVSKIRGRLFIYQNAYRGRLIDALRDNYPILHRALGDEGFDALAEAYIEAHPSTHRSIRWFGGEMDGFVRSNDRYIPHPALADIARMEWALRTAFDAPDSSSLTLADFQNLAPENYANLCLVFIAAIQMPFMQWAIEPIWHTLNSDPDAQTTVPEDYPHTLLIWRNNFETLWRALDQEEAILLQAARRNESFGALCELLIAAHGEEQAAICAANYLGRWVADGMIAGYQINA